MKTILLFFLAGWLTGSAFAQPDQYSHQRELRSNGKLIREDYMPTPFQSIANQQQVAMTGRDVTGKLIVTLKTSDNGRTYNLPTK